jgi:hypothetical protein
MALDDIYASLELLEEQIETLETDLQEQEDRNLKLMQHAVASAIAKTKAEVKAESRKSQAPDLFSQNWVQPVTITKPSNDKNSAILAQKLDSTIEKVQALLREAGA